MSTWWNFLQNYSRCCRTMWITSDQWVVVISLLSLWLSFANLPHLPWSTLSYLPHSLWDLIHSSDCFRRDLKTFVFTSYQRTQRITGLPIIVLYIKSTKRRFINSLSTASFQMVPLISVQTTDSYTVYSIAGCITGQSYNRKSSHSQGAIL